VGGWRLVTLMAGLLVFAWVVAGKCVVGGSTTGHSRG
jgi:hypothetical protein